MALAVSRRPHTAEARVRGRSVHVRFVVDIGFTLSIYHSTFALQTHIILGMNSMSASGSNSETWSHPVTINRYFYLV
jgi:hypothetical protein